MTDLQVGTGVSVKAENERRDVGCLKIEIWRRYGDHSGYPCMHLLDILDRPEGWETLRFAVELRIYTECIYKKQQTLTL